MSNITAVVPTRKGSERVKNKNTKPFLDTTLLENKLKTLIKLKENNIINDIILNSDCDESYKISKKLNIKFVWRESTYADSKCDIRDYWLNVGTNISTNNFMLCQVTSPFISYKTYEKCIKIFNEGNPILTVTKLKDYIWEGNKPLNYSYPEHPRSQDLPDNFFKLNFGVCIMSKKDLKQYKNLWIPNTKFVYLNEIESIDIDTELDFKLAASITSSGIESFVCESTPT